MTQKIRDAIGNIADVIKRVGQNGKEHVIIKKSYVEKLSPIPEKLFVTPENPLSQTIRSSRSEGEDVAKLVAMRMKDWKRK
jgi:hypothetical protein